MRTLQELINVDDSGWAILQGWIEEAKNDIEILPCDKQNAEQALFYTQVTTRSLMGAIVYETGGILVDRGWIRLLGSGCEQMKRSLPEWNKGKTFNEFGEAPPFLLVADDAVGGFFAINGGFLGNDAGNIYYFSPDSLNWEGLEISYSEFLTFCFDGNLDDFYQNVRWSGWKEDVSILNPDFAYSFFPFLWTKEGKDINQVSRKAIPVGEIYNLNMDIELKLK
jgi:hypothetical protein